MIYEDPTPDIELAPMYQEGILNVLLDDELLAFDLVTLLLMSWL